MSAPFMQLYVADYLGDTQHLTTEQHGAYLLLLMTMWRQGGSLPNDDRMLARIARVSARRWHLIRSEVMAFFASENGSVTQKRLVEEYQKAVSKSEKRSVCGKLGGEAKALKDKEVAAAKAKQKPQHSSEPEPEEAKASKARKRADADPSFAEFWEVYPIRVGKGQAERAYAAALKTADAGTILASARQYAAQRIGQDPKYTRHAATWLNGKGWLDEAPARAASSDRPRDLRDINDPVERAKAQFF